PSHYGPGVFGFDVPNEHPYDVVARTLGLMRDQTAGLPVVLRPWIQDFGYGDFPPYGPADVRAEMQAAADAGAGGWMIWNPGGEFTEAALAAPREGEDAGPVTEPPAVVPGEDAGPTGAASPVASLEETPAAAASGAP
ncbi:MAG TPA: putative glycoside hydrolase, partial [Candidatus Limnocylindria bacterium]|nr:putative glycoside hydrolase [Candidatus Limnocylindria bacterium]